MVRRVQSGRQFDWTATKWDRPHFWPKGYSNWRHLLWKMRIRNNTQPVGREMIMSRWYVR